MRDEVAKFRAGGEASDDAVIEFELGFDFVAQHVTDAVTRAHRHAARQRRHRQPRAHLTIETGLQIRVPLFIKEGEKVKVHTETREFAGRA